MPNVNRVKRSLFRSGELQECLTPTCSQGFEVPAVEIVGPVDGTQDGFDSGGEPLEGVNAANKSRPVELNPTGQLWKEGEDFAVGNAQGPARTVPEPPPYEAAVEAASNDRALTASGFQAVEDVPETARVEQAAQASAAEMESRRFAEVAEQPFSLTGRVEVRA